MAKQAEKAILIIEVMLPNSSQHSHYAGYVGLSVVVFMLMLSMLFFPYFFPSGGTSGDCKAGVPPDEEVIVTWPAIDGGETGLPVEEQPTMEYKLIRKNVPVTAFTHLSIFYPEAWEGSSGNAVHMTRIMYLSGEELLMYPKKNFGEHTIESRNGKAQRGVHLWGEGIAFVMHMEGGSTPKIYATRVPEVEGRGGETEELIRMVDVYQRVENAAAVENGTAAYTHEELFECDGGGPLPSHEGNVIVPPQEVSARKEQLQLEWFQFDPPIGVWGTHCKPAVYLYPRQKQLVNVRVYPKGELTYTDPVYDELRGWTVWAEPGGNLEFGISNLESRKYDYLYYESKLLDSEIRKPQEGWVVKSGDMAMLLDRILPQLGLNEKEKADFEEYWLGKLPESPYYFVGLIDKQQRDYLETLDVTPDPETSIRFSLFFEQLDEFRIVKEPSIVTPKREGFTLVDWGGMIKLHPGTEFTCSQ